MLSMPKYPYDIFPNPEHLPQLPEELLRDGNNYYERLKQRASPEDMAEFERYPELMYVLSMSDFVAKTMIQYPAECAALFRQGAIDSSYFSLDASDVIAARIVAGLSDMELKKRLRVLRRVRMVIIAWRDLTGRSDIEEVFVSLSNLAEGIVERTVDVVRAGMQSVFGNAFDDKGAEMPLLILGMGKLGGGELNFSSDIDLLCCYPYDGQTQGGSRSISHQEYFTKVVQRLSNLLSETTADSFCYRIDLRLRPFGDAGPLVSSFDALSSYYETQGRTWERYALVKAKLIGDYHKWGSYGAELIELLRPFVYRRYLDYGAIESLRKIKHMIEAEVRRRNLVDNFKLGSGGIREIEFIAQVFELMRGGRIQELVERSLRKTLRNISKLQLLPEDVCQRLDECYIYLRRLENITQMLADKQTQSLPNNDNDKMRVAIGMNKQSFDELKAELDHIRTQVHQEFVSVMRDDPQSDSQSTENVELWESSLSAEELASILEPLMADDDSESTSTSTSTSTSASTSSSASGAGDASNAAATTATANTASNASAGTAATASSTTTTTSINASLSHGGTISHTAGFASVAAAARAARYAAAAQQAAQAAAKKAQAEEAQKVAQVAAIAGNSTANGAANTSASAAASSANNNNSAGGGSNHAQALALAQSIIQLHHTLGRMPVGPIGRETLVKLMPKLIRAVAKYKNASSLFNKVALLLEKVALRTTYLQLLLENDSTRTKLLSLLDGNDFAGALICAHPILLDELIAPRYFTVPPRPEEYLSWLNERLLRIEPDDLEEQMEELRLFKKIMVLRIAMSDQSQSLPLMKISDSLTWLAEALLRELAMLAWRHTVQKYGAPQDRDITDPGFAIIGYGKLGGIELGYKSDLDMVFIREVSDADTTGVTGSDGSDGHNKVPAAMFYQRFVQRLMHLCTTRMSGGVLYDLDMRLRPDGDSGVLMTDLDAYEQYQKNRAWTWEHQALVRARAVAGSPKVIEGFNRIRDEVLRTPRDEVKLSDDVYAMRMKMRNYLDRSSDKLFDLKQGRGGMVDIEFIAQYLLLREAPRHPDMVLWSDNVRIFDECARLGIITQEKTDTLKNAYLAIRECYHRVSLADLPRIVSIADRPHECDDVVVIFDEIFKDAAARFVPPHYSKSNSLPSVTL